MRNTTSRSRLVANISCTSHHQTAWLCKQPNGKLRDTNHQLYNNASAALFQFSKCITVPPTTESPVYVITSSSSVLHMTPYRISGTHQMVLPVLGTAYIVTVILYVDLYRRKRNIAQNQTWRPSVMFIRIWPSYGMLSSTWTKLQSSHPLLLPTLQKTEEEKDRFVADLAAFL